MKNRIKIFGLCVAVGAIFLFGFTAILGKLVSLPNVEMVFYRTLLAAIGMAIVILITKGSFKVPTQKDFWKLIVTGLIVAAHWLTFFGSGRLSNPSVSLDMRQIRHRWRMVSKHDDGSAKT